MDELTAMREFQAERVKPNPTSRAAARRELEARFESTPTGPAPTTTAVPRRRLLPHRRRLLVFAGATAFASVAVGILVLSSGPTAQPAAAEVLRQTAAVAATAGITPEAPGPGELLYSRTRSRAVWGWDSGGDFVGLAAAADRGDAFTALATIEAETWTSAEGTVRFREELSSIQFPSDSERSSWKDAGVPLPGQFDPGAGEVHEEAFAHILGSGGRVLELRRGVVDLELAPGHQRGQPVIEPPDPSTLPTEPKALRRAVEQNGYSVGAKIGEAGEVTRSPSRRVVDPEETIFGIWTILSRSTTTETPAAVRAAAFDALAEMPDIELERDATDLVGRPGDAIAYRGDGGDGGLRHEFVFDPETSRVLGERGVIVDPQQGFTKTDLPAGTVISETAYLRTAIVESSNQRPDEAKRRIGRVASGPEVVSHRRRAGRSGGRR